MHIAIDYTPAVRQAAGIGRLTRQIVRELLALDSDHHYTLFIAGPIPPDLSSSVGLPKHARLRGTLLPERWLTIFWHRARLPLPLEAFIGPCALFHSTDFVLPPAAGARTIVTVHDLTFLRHPECAHPPLRAYLQNVVPRSLRRANRVIADSQATRMDLITLLGVPAEKIAVIYGGVDERFAPAGDPNADRAARLRYGLEQPYILSVGTIEPRKNYLRLIRAYDRLRQAIPHPPQLAIAGGKGWLYHEIFAEVERRQLSEAVRFLGFVADANLPALYRGAELFVFPSLYEGFGLPPLEAMACGCPVVCSRASSLPEVVGDAAILVSPQDDAELHAAMELALTDDERRRSLSARGLARAASFTWRKAAQRLLEEYERVLGEKKA